jgi:hypothetical protein
VSEIWTVEERAPAPILRFLPASITIAAAGLLLIACGSSSSENRISPIHADIQIDNPGTFPDPSIFLQRVSASGDLVVVDLMLRSSSAVTFDAIDVDLKFDPGIVHLGGDIFDQAFNKTPFCAPDATDPLHALTCACNASVTNLCSGTILTACSDDSECTPDTCILTCTTAPTTNPLCLTNAAAADSTGELILSIDANTGSGCGAFTKAAGSPDLRLFRLGLTAASTGSSQIELVPFSLPQNPGGCAILHNVTNVGIACASGNALFTAGR